MVQKATYRELEQRVRELERGVFESKRAEEALQESELKFRGVIEQSAEGILITDEQGIVTEWNRSMESITGLKAAEMIGKPVWDIQSGMNAPGVKSAAYKKQLEAMVRGILATGQIPEHATSQERAYSHPDGSLHHVSSTLSSIRTEKGYMVASIARDITEKKKVEHVLQESEERYRSLFESSRDAIVMTSRDGKYIEVNRAAIDLFGYTRDEMMAINAKDTYVDPADREKLLKTIEPKGYVKDYELRLKKKYGTEVTCLTTTTLRYDDGGNVIGAQGVIRDITEQRLAEDALRKERDKAQNYLCIAGAIILVIEVDQIVSLVNRKGCEVLGYKEEEIVGKDWFANFLPETMRDQVRAYFTHMIAEEIEPYESYENPILTKSGGERICSWTAALLRDTEGNVTGVLSSGIDITEKVKAEERLRESEQKHRALFEDSRDAIVINTLEGKHVASNQAAMDMFGYTKEEMLRTNALETYANPDDRPKLIAALAKRGFVKDYSLRLRKKNGTEMDCLTTTSVVYDENGNAVGSQSILRDVTEQKRTERTLEVINKKLTSHIENSPLGVIEWDHEFRLSYASTRARNIFGWSADEHLGKSPEEWKFVYDDDQESVREVMASLILHRHPRNVSRNRNYRKDGSVIYCDWYNSVLYDEQGNLMSVLSLIEDVTDRKQVEDRLKITQYAVDHEAEAAFWMGPDANLVYVNEAACRSLGYSREELLSMNVRDFDLGLPPEAWPDHWKEVKERQSFTLESRHRTKDGRLFPVEVTVNYMKYDDREYNFAFVRDISARKRAEEEIRCSEEKYRSLYESSRDGIASTDMQGNFLDANKAFLSMLGYSMAELKKLDYERITPEKWHQRESNNIEKQILVRGYSDEYEKEYIRKDGTVFPITIRAWLIKDAHAKPTGFWVIVRDITEIKKTQIQLIEAEKMGALGTLTAGIAHELNNPLMGMINFIQYCIEKIPSDAKVHAILKDAEHETKRCIDIVRNLLTFSRIEKGEEERYVKMPCKIIFDRILRLLSYRVEKEDVDVMQHIEEGIPEIWIKASNMQQVFLNLIGNALDALEGTNKKELCIDARRRGEFVRMAVGDTGCGIVPENLARIYDPFFTTKPVGKGTGLGLSVSASIIRDHGGELLCESEPGIGTTFIVLLPIKGYEERMEE